MTDKLTQQLDQFITRIEGHGVLRVDFKQNQARMEVSEGERMFEGMVLGHKYSQAPWITMRICGVCPIAHSIAAIKAVENALGFVPNPTITNLRKLLLTGQIIGSHLLHLFFLVLPDYLGVSGADELARRYPAEFHLALNIKRFCDRITEVVGGRTVHPVRAVAGGFTEVPTEDELGELRSLLEDTYDEAQEIVGLFAQQEFPQLDVLQEMVASFSEVEYALYGGEIKSLQSGRFDPAELETHIREEVRQYSAAKFSFLQGKTYFTGALARLNLSSTRLHPLAQRCYQELFSSGELRNPFYNNLAQAVEIVHCYEEARRLLEWLFQRGDLRDGLQKKLEKSDYSGGYGAGCTEAPRGLLYHGVRLRGDFLIKEYNVITPTSQNVANLETTCQRLMDEYREESNQRKRQLIKMLIRAYDPCLTCSVH